MRKESRSNVKRSVVEISARALRSNLALRMTLASGLMLALGLMVVEMPAALAQASGSGSPALTTVSDTIFRADGNPAQGVVLISWPTFMTAASGGSGSGAQTGYAVAAGNQTVTIGAGGAFTDQLVPNAGSTPTGTLYTAVYQLDDGTVRTEYWSVGTTSPTTIAAILTTPGTGLGNTVATEQWVNAAVANLAVNFAPNSTVVHLAGAETITGTKTFAVPPSLPQPGRMKIAEDRIVALEHNDIKRNVYDRIVTAAIAFAVSALIALHDHFLPK